jgi:hypothetical protein
MLPPNPDHMVQREHSRKLADATASLNRRLGLPPADSSVRNLALATPDQWYDHYNEVNGARDFIGVSTTLTSFFHSPAVYVSASGELLSAKVRQPGTAARLGAMVSRAIEKMDGTTTKLVNRWFGL